MRFPWNVKKTSLPISTDQAPQAIGPYSQAIFRSPMYFLSGQLPLNLKGELEGKGIEEQTLQVFKNIKAILKAKGLCLKDVVNTTIYLKNLSDFSQMNEIYEKQFQECLAVYPARTTIEVSALPRQALIEISCIAMES